MKSSFTIWAILATLAVASPLLEAAQDLEKRCNSLRDCCNAFCDRCCSGLVCVGSTGFTPGICLTAPEAEQYEMSLEAAGGGNGN